MPELEVKELAKQLAKESAKKLASNIMSAIRGDDVSCPFCASVPLKYDPLQILEEGVFLALNAVIACTTRKLPEPRSC